MPEQAEQSRAALAPHFAPSPDGDENRKRAQCRRRRAARPPALSHVPLIVRSTTGVDPTQAHLRPEDAVRDMNAAEDTGHGRIHEERPDAVMEALRDLPRSAGPVSTPAG